jgi:hypothetical protein
MSPESFVKGGTPQEDYDQRLTEMYPGQLKNLRLLVPEAHDLG